MTASTTKRLLVFFAILTALAFGLMGAHTLTAPHAFVAHPGQVVACSDFTDCPH